MKTKISSEVAFNELKAFLKAKLPKDFRRGKITDENIKEEYPAVLEAIEDGLLVFDEKGSPNYTLEFPLFAESDDQSLVVKSVNFRSRIKGADRTVLINGLDPKKDLGTYMIKMISYICNLSATEVKELEKDDFEVLNQICSVF